MPSVLIRFAALHFSVGMLLGMILAAAFLFGGGFENANKPADRLLGFLMLTASLGGVLGISSFATALHFAAEQD